MKPLSAAPEDSEPPLPLALLAFSALVPLPSEVGWGLWPLFTQRKMAMMLKFAASSIALGRYVPMLTNLSFWIRR
jgi:hypothetical protein